MGQGENIFKNRPLLEINEYHHRSLIETAKRLILLSLIGNNLNLSNPRDDLLKFAVDTYRKTTPKVPLVELFDYKNKTYTSVK